MKTCFRHRMVEWFLAYGHADIFNVSINTISVHNRAVNPYLCLHFSPNERRLC